MANAVGVAQAQQSLANANDQYYTRFGVEFPMLQEKCFDHESGPRDRDENT
jgi:hypothetical protein